MKTDRIISSALFILVAGLVTAQAQESTSITSRRDGSRIVIDNGFQSFDVETRGKIDVTDDDRDIKSMSPDGYLKITKTVFGSRRTLVVQPAGSGLKREYYEGRTQLDFEPEGKKWLAEILPELVNTTTIAAESRVARFFKQGGTTGVLNAINRIESDYVKQHYASLLMTTSGVTAKEYSTIINQMARTLDSDYYLSEFLSNSLDKFLADKAATEAVFAATEQMDSDHYRTQIIKEALRNQPASLESIKIILNASNNMDSDHYKTEVLTALMRQQNLTDAIMAEVINSAKSLESDHYKTQVITKALSMKNLSGPSYQKVLESVRDMDSDHYKTEILKNLLSNKLPADQIFTLVDLSTSIDSDHYLNVIFQEVLKNQEMSDESFKAIVDRAANTDSDHYASQILQAALNVPKLTDAKLISILNAAARIDSDHYITEILTEAAPLVKPAGGPVKDAYRAAAKKIDSETYYGRALRALD